MTRSIVLALASLLVAGCAIGPEDSGDSLATATQALTGCPGARQQSGGTIGIGQTIAGGWITTSAGQRILAKMVGVTSPGHADLYLQRAGSSSWVAASATSGTSTEIIDIAAPVSDSYRVVAVGADGTDTVRFTLDVSDSACGAPGQPVDYCFGAIGINCNGIWPAASCSTNSDATVTCQNSVGAQMHDTCCSFNPLGSHCGGTACNPGTSGTNCGYVSDCSAEYNHAQNDVSTTRTYSHTYDATAPTYRPTAIAKWPGSDRNVAQPKASSMLTPVGSALWDTDAKNGWCTNPTSYSIYWSLQGYYAVCK